MTQEKLNIKRFVGNRITGLPNEVKFEYYRQGFFYYRVDDLLIERDWYIFPIPIDDIGSASLNKKDKAMGKKYDVISPDGFEIHPTETYPSKKAAEAAFEEWKKRYEMQGYYSSVNFGHIPLDELHEYCKLHLIHT